MELNNQYLKDRIASFDDYYSYIKEESNLFNVYNGIQSLFLYKMKQ